jgi:hypothetical protein
MTRRLILLLTFATFALFYAAPNAVAQKPNTQLANGSFVLGLTDAGEVTCVGGTPTGWFPPCTPETHIAVWRNYTGAIFFVAVEGEAAPFLAGTWTVQGNCNLDENLVGPCWGTFQGSALDGTWDGTWSGTLDFVRFGGELRFVGHGTGGGVQRLHLRLDGASEGSADEYAPMPFTARVFRVEP